MCMYDSKNAIFSHRESTTHLNNCCSYIYSIHLALCQQVSDDWCLPLCQPRYIASLSLNHNFGDLSNSIADVPSVRSNTLPHYVTDGTTTLPSLLYHGIPVCLRPPLNAISMAALHGQTIGDDVLKSRLQASIDAIQLRPSFPDVNAVILINEQQFNGGEQRYNWGNSVHASPMRTSAITE